MIFALPNKSIPSRMLVSYPNKKLSDLTTLNQTSSFRNHVHRLFLNVCLHWVFNMFCLHSSHLWCCFPTRFGFQMTLLERSRRVAHLNFWAKSRRRWPWIPGCGNFFAGTKGWFRDFVFRIWDANLKCLSSKIQMCSNILLRQEHDMGFSWSFTGLLGLGGHSLEVFWGWFGWFFSG